MAKWDIEAVRKRAKQKDKEEEIRNLYAETADREQAIQRAYNEGRTVDNAFATQTRGMQDKLQSYVDNDAEFIKNVFGNKAYDALKADSQAMQKSVSREYFSDYQNTSDFVNSSYEDKQAYLGDQVKEEKKNLFEKGLDYLSSALGSYVLGNTYNAAPTQRNQEAVDNANNKTAEAVDAYKKKQEDINALEQQRADIYNEEYTQKNLALLQNDKELAKLVKEAYEAKAEKDAVLDPIAMRESGGMPVIGTDAKISRFNEIYQSIMDKGYSQEETNDLIEAYTREQNRIAAEEQAERNKEFADNHPFTASLGYVGANALQMAAVPEIIQSGLGNAIDGDYVPMDTNTDAFMFTRYRGTVSETVSENIQREMQEKTNSEFWSHAATFAYQTGLSIGDFASLALLPEPVSLAIMGTSAGVTAVKDATDRGVSADQALMTGLTAGAAEIVFEKFSLENFNALRASGKKGIKNFVMDILKQSFTEGSEEVFTDIANAITDQLINHDKSELELQYKALLKEYNGDINKAWKALAKQFGLQLIESFSGGALSGGVMGTFGSAMNNYNLSRVGNDIIRSNGTGATDLTTLMNVAEQLDSKTESGKMLEKIRGKKGNPSNATIGALYVSVVNDIADNFSKAENMQALTESYLDVVDGVGGEFRSVISQAYHKAAEELNAKTSIADGSTDSKTGSKASVKNTETAVNAEEIKSTEISDKNTFSIPAVSVSNGNSTTITGVASTHNGEITLKTDTGDVLSLNDVDFSNDNITSIITDAAKLGTSGAAVYIKNAIDMNVGSSNYTTYKAYAAQMYRFGVVGSEWDKISNHISPMINTLGNDTARALYDAGVADNKILNTIRESKKLAKKTSKKAVQRTSDGKVNNETNDSGLDDVFKAVAKHLHININYVADGGENGSFDPATATLTIVKGAKRGDATTLAHEIGEYARAYNYDAYKQYVDTVIDYLFAIDAVSTEQDIMAYHRTYHNDNNTTTIQDAKEELVNDVTARLFFAEGGIEQIVEHISESKEISVEEKKNFLETLKEIVNKIVNVIKQYVTNNGLRASEKAVGNMSLNDIQQLRSQFLEVIDGAIENLENGVEVDTSTTGIKLSQDINEYPYDMQKVIADYINAVDNELLDFVNDVKSESNKKRLEYMHKYIPFNNETILTLISDIVGFDVNSYRTKIGGESIRHIEKRHGENGKQDHSMQDPRDVSRIVYVLNNADNVERGLTKKGELRYSKKYRGKNNSPSDVVVISKKINGTYYVVVAVPDSKAQCLNIISAYIGNKKETAQEFDELFPKPTPEANLESVSTDSISENDENVNTKKSLDVDSDGNTLSEQQKEFFKDSKVRDENGNLLVVYHGTPTPGFTEYRRNHNFFTDNIDVADTYTNNDGIYKQYLNITKPLVINANGEKWSMLDVSNLSIDGIDDIVAFLNDNGASVWNEDGALRTSTADLVAAVEDAIDEGYIDVDGIIIKDIIDDGSYGDYNEAHLGTDYVTFNSNQAKNTDNTNPTKNSDIRFSLDVPVEETKELIAVHNMHEAELIKTLELGGFAMPSIAIMKAKQANANSGYGEISVVFDKRAIDPSANSDNKVYGGDAWTPTFPSIEYEINENLAADLYKKVRELAKKKAVYKINPVAFHPDNIEDNINRFGGIDGLIEKYKNDISMKQLYLAEQDNQVQEFEKTEKETIIVDKNQKALFDYLLTCDIPFLNDEKPINKIWYDKYGDLFKQFLSDYYKSKFPDITDEQLNNIHKNAFPKPLDYVLLARKVRDYKTYGTTKVDIVDNTEAAENEIESRVNSSDFEKWLNNLLNGIVKKSGIYNGSDYYTPSGNRKSFTATHYAVTLENVVKAMKQQEDVGNSTFFSGLGIWGVAAKKYGTLDEIIADKDRLQLMNEEEYNELKRSFGERFGEIAGSLENKYKADNPYIDYDNTATNIIESIRTAKTKSGLLSNLNKWFVNASETTVDDILNLVSDIGNMPTGYFEAKPQRAVNMNEVARVVIPDNASEELISTLDKAGVSYEMYEAGNEEERVSILNSLDSVKFSKDVEDTDTNSLIKQNKKLQKAVEYYKTMASRNSGHKVERKQIRQYAAELKKSWNSTMSVDDISDSLAELFDYISSGNAAWGTIELMGRNLGKALVDSQREEISPESKEVLDYLKSHTIRIDEYQRAEIKYLYGDVSTWLNTIRKGVRYSVNDGISLDSAWLELSADYPYLFDPETTSNDQPQRLYEAIESLYDTVDNDYGYTDDELAESIMLDIYDKYFDMPEIVTPLDRMDKKLNQERLDNKRRLEEVKQTDKERYEKKVQQVKEYYQDMNKRLRDEKNAATLEKLARQKAKYEDKEKRVKDTRERSRLRASIRRQLNKILSLASNPTKEKHIPNAIVDSVKALCEAVTLDETQYDARLRDKLNAFKDGFEENASNTQYSVISELYNDYIHDKVADLNKRYGDVPLKQLPVEALREINDLIKMTAQSINNINRLFKKEQNATIEDFAEKAVAELDTLRKTKLYDGRVKSLFYNSMKPEYFFEYMGSETLSELYHDLRNGEDVWAVDVTNAREFIVETRKKHKFSEWDFNTENEFNSKDGKIQLTLQEMLGIYANSIGEHTRKNLLGGGFVYQTEERKGLKRFAPKKNDNGNYRLSLEDVTEIISALTDEQKAYVRDMIKYLSSEMGAKGNEVARELYGVELFKEEMYYPAIINKDSRHQSSKEVRADKKIKNAGFTNAIVPEATQPVVLKDFDAVWAAHVDEMSKYHAFALAMENIDRVYNLYSVSDSKYSSTKEAIRNAHGDKAISYIDDLLKDINGGVVKEAGTDIVSSFMSKFKKNAVFASMSVVVQQPSAIGRALSEIDAKYFAMTTGSGFSRKAYEEMKKYAPVAAIKEMGYFDTNMAQSTIDFLNNNEYEGFANKIKAFVVDGSYRDEAMSFFAAKADEITWTHIWNACKAEAKANNKNANKEEICEAAAKKFTDVIVKTQVYDSVFSRSGLMRSNDNLVKNAMAFMAEPTTSVNMLANAIIQVKRGNMSKAKGAKVLGSLVAASILNSLLQSIITAARADGDDDDWKEVYLAQLLPNFIDNLNPINQIGFVKDVVSIFKGYDVSRSDMQVFVDLYTAFQNMHNGNVSLYKKIESLAGALAGFFGLPVKNVMRDIDSAINVGKDFIDEKQYSSEHALELFKEEMNSAVGFDLFVTAKDKRFKILYDSTIKGDKNKYDKTYKELENLGLDESKMENGVKAAITNYDVRAAEAALAYNDGNLDKYISYINEIVKDGFDEALVKKAVSSYLTDLKAAKQYKDEGDEDKYNKKLKELLNSGADKERVETAIDKIEIDDEERDEEKQIYKWDDIYSALDNGYSTAYKQMYNNALQTKIKNGKSEEEAKEEIKKKLQSHYRQDYIENKSVRSEIERKLNTTGLFSQDDYDDWAARSYDTDSMKKAFEEGASSTQNYVTERINAKVKNGMDRKSAENGIKTSISNAYKQDYINGDQNTRMRIVTYMTNTGLYGGREEVVQYINKNWLK